eukprot:2615868-Rhodomonas_salina.2
MEELGRIVEELEQEQSVSETTIEELDRGAQSCPQEAEVEAADRCHGRGGSRCPGEEIHRSHRRHSSLRRLWRPVVEKPCADHRKVSCTFRGAVASLHDPRLLAQECALKTDGWRQGPGQQNDTRNLASAAVPLGQWAGPE